VRRSLARFGVAAAYALAILELAPRCVEGAAERNVEVLVKVFARCRL